MVVKVKVCVNADEINEAKRKNEFYQQQRDLNKNRKPKDKVEVPDDVEIPQQKVEVHERLWDSRDVVEAYINEFNKDMISVVHLYSKVQMIIYTDEVWAELQERFSAKLNFEKLN